MNKGSQLNDAVAAAVAEWREYHIPEVGNDGHGVTRYVQPAIVKALIEAVTTNRGHTACSLNVCNAYERAILVSNISADCHGTGRVPRGWEEIGEGALEGVLRHWYFGVVPSVFIREFYLHTSLGNSVALAVVGKAVKQKFGGTIG